MNTKRRTLAVMLAVGTAASLTACATTTKGSGTHSALAPTSGASSFVAASTSASPAASPSSAPASSTHASTPPTTSSAPVPTTPLRTETVTSPDGATKWVVNIWVEVNDTIDCENHAYGAPVIAYLKANLCRGMSRLLASTTVGGRPVGIAQTLISFTGASPAVYETAAHFKDLVTQDGTGSINDLLREGKRFPNSGAAIGSPDAFAAESQDAGAGIYDVWYLDGPTAENTPPLLTLAQDLFLQLN